MQRHRRFVLLSLALSAIVLAPPPLTAQSGDRGALRPSDPIVCQGTRTIEIRERYIESEGNGVVSQGNCDVRIVSSHVVARGVGVLVQGRGRVEITDSTIEGRGAALVASGRAVIRYEKTVLHGAVQSQGSARIEGDDGPVPPTAPATGGRIRIGEGGVRLESDDGSSIAIGAGGLRMENGDGSSEIRIGPGGVQLEAGDPSASGEDVSKLLEPGATWRVAGAEMRAGDAERLIADLGGRVEEGTLQLALAGDVLFDFSSDTLRPEAGERLSRVAQLIRAGAVGPVLVVGHTDSVGDAESNQRLSERRAASVMRWLRDREGIPGILMRGEGMGARKPIVHNTHPDGSDDPEGRARNRRVEIRFALER